MWEAIKGLIGPVIGVIGSLVGGGPLGLIGFAVGVIGLLIGGIWVYNKYKNFLFDKAHKDQNEQSTKIHEKVIDENTKHSDADKITFDQSKKDKEGAFDGNSK